MAREFQVGLPESKQEAEKAWLVAGVVLVVAVTPTLFDAYDAWQSHPNVRTTLILWYLFAGIVALSSWQVFLGGD